MNKRQLQLWIASLAAGAALVLTGCGTQDSDYAGDPGKIVGRDKDKVGSSYDYDLTIERTRAADIDEAGGSRTYEIDVTASAYDHCYRGSSYPKCVDR